ncbi:MAG: cytochrome c biogenesis protein DipZ, partial [Catenulispora sp.]|nr:cytochrome c biogenesis protein DipZ [Catenulispora sp.]
EAAIRTLLAKHGATLDPEPAAVRADGIEVPADWAALRSAETYVGYERTANFASPDGLTGDGARTYEVPPTLALDQWALRGQWIVGPQAAVSIAADGQIVYRFHARDLHLVLASPIGGRARFRVRLDGRPPGADHGVDVDANGFGTLTEPRLYQLIRQAGRISDRTFEITFLDAGAGAYAFTFG